MRIRGLITAALLLGAGCGGSTSTTPAAPTGLNIAGTWSGTMTHSVAGPGTLKVTVTQSAGELFGNWTITLDDSGLNDLQIQVGRGSGDITGFVTGSSLFIELAPKSLGSCSYIISTTSNGASINTKWQYKAGCISPGEGSVALTKQ